MADRSVSGPRGSAPISHDPAETNTGLTWRDRVLAVRDRIVGDRRFQRWAAGFPLTRPIARRQAQALFDLCAGFVYSQVLLAVVRLGLLDLVADRPMTGDEIAARTGLASDPCNRLLAAAAALDLLSRRSGGRYGLGMLGAALRANPGVAAMIEHHGALYADIVDPVGLLRRDEAATRLGGYWPYASAENPAALPGDATAAYTALMAASQDLIADDIIEAYPLKRHRRLLDVGGGDGTFLAAVAQKAPALDLVLFDLPAVAERARQRFDATKPAARVTLVGGSFLADDLPTGADLVTLVRVILDHDDATVLHVLKAIRRAITPGGTLLVAEPLSGVRGVERTSDAYFGIYLMAMGRGRPRSYADITRLLTAAGFRAPRLLRTRRPMLTSVIEARTDPQT